LRSIVNHIHLARVEPRLELRERYIEPKGGGFPVGSIGLLSLDTRGVLRFGPTAEEGNIGQQPDSGARLLCRSATRWIINLIVEVKMLRIVEVKMLRGREYVGNAGDHLRPVAHHGILALALSCRLNLAREHHRTHLH